MARGPRSVVSKAWGRRREGRTWRRRSGFSNSVVDAFVDDEAFGGDAGLWPLLTQRALTAFSTAKSRLAEGHDDEGVGAAELEDRFFDEPAGLGSDGAAGGLGAGEGDGGDAGVVEEVFLPGGPSMRRVWKTPRGKPARRTNASMASAHWGTLEACLRRPTLPAMSAGASKAEDLPEGEVPGHDGEDDAEWVVADVGFFLVGGARVRQGWDAFGGEDTWTALSA